MKAAIWWRVSTDDQKDLSPDTQQTDSLALAQQEGFEVPAEFVLGTNWHSLSVWESPPMEQLKMLIRSKAIHAVYVYHPDRLPSRPAHRLLLRALCEDNGISIRCVYGQLPDGEFGEVMTFLDSWAKEKQVKRAQQSAKDGLRDRVLLRGLPANGKTPYGFKLRYEMTNDKRVPVAFEPDGERYFVAQRIWGQALQGAPLRAICRGLVDDGIPSPGGTSSWAPATVLRLLRNPLYGGRCYSKRSERVAGETRTGKPSRFEKNSERRVQQEDWVQLPDFPVESQIVTWEQWEGMQSRLKENKRLSKRNGHQVYLLSGMAVCGECGWRLSAAKRSDRDNHYYRCQKRMRLSIGVEKCGTLPVNGKKADQSVWDNIYAFLTDPETFLSEMKRRQGEHVSQEDDIQRSLQTLENKVNKVIEMETALALKNVRGEVSDEAHHRAAAMLKAERTHYQEEIERQRVSLETYSNINQSMESLVALRDRMASRLDSASPEDKRWILEALGTRVVVKGTELEISIGGGPRSDVGVYVAETEVA